MNFLPVSINIENETILIIGGGRVAAHKLIAIEKFTKKIKIIAPEIADEIKEKQYIEVVQKEYEPNDLEGHLLVYAATNNHELNSCIRNDARKYRCIVNVVDKPANCDFVSPAIYKNNNMSVAVSSNGENVFAAIEWKNAFERLVNEGVIPPVKPKEHYKSTIYANK